MRSHPSPCSLAPPASRTNRSRKSQSTRAPSEPAKEHVYPVNSMRALNPDICYKVALCAILIRLKNHVPACSRKAIACMPAIARPSRVCLPSQGHRGMPGHEEGLLPQHGERAHLLPHSNNGHSMHSRQQTVELNRGYTAGMNRRCTDELDSWRIAGMDRRCTVKMDSWCTAGGKGWWIIYRICSYSTKLHDSG